MDSYMAFRQLEEEELLEVDGGSVKAVAVGATAVAAACDFGAVVAKWCGYNDLAGGLAGLGALATTVATVCTVVPLL